MTLTLVRSVRRAAWTSRVRRAGVAIATIAFAMGGCHDVPTAPHRQAAPSVVARWNSAALDAVRHTHLGPPMVARALAVANTAMYDAWSAYDAAAVGTRSGG